MSRDGITLFMAESRFANEDIFFPYYFSRNLGISTLYWPPPSFFDFMLPTGFLGAENDGTEDKTWRSTTYS